MISVWLSGTYSTGTRYCIYKFGSREQSLCLAAVRRVYQYGRTDYGRWINLKIVCLFYGIDTRYSNHLVQMKESTNHCRRTVHGLFVSPSCVDTSSRFTKPWQRIFYLTPLVQTALSRLSVILPTQIDYLPDSVDDEVSWPWSSLMACLSIREVIRRGSFQENLVPMESDKQRRWNVVHGPSSRLRRLLFRSTRCLRNRPMRSFFVVDDDCIWNVRRAMFESVETHAFFPFFNWHRLKIWVSNSQ